MKAIIYLTLASVMFLPSICIAALSLWALDMGHMWGGTETAYGIQPEPFIYSEIVYPSQFSTSIGFAYDAADSIFCVSGWPWRSPDPWYYQNTIGLFTGGPDGLSFVSSSKAGMGNYHWTNGLEFMGKDLYATGFINYQEGNVLLRIDNPGTPAQKAVLLGQLGATSAMGDPLGICKDGQGGLYALFEGVRARLYRIDVQTATATLLRQYTSSDFATYGIYDLTFANNALFALGMDGKIYEIDQTTYDVTQIGEIPQNNRSWNGLVTIPEPSLIVILLSGIVGLLYQAKKSIYHT